MITRIAQKLTPFVILASSLGLLAKSANAQVVITIPTPTAEVKAESEIQVATIEAQPSAFSLSGSGQSNVPTYEVKLPLESIPTESEITEVSLNFAQLGVSTGIIKLVDIRTSNVIDSMSLGTEGQRSSTRIENIAQDWITYPSRNFGLLFQTVDLASDAEVAISNLNLTISYIVPDVTDPTIQSVTIEPIDASSVRVRWVASEKVIGYIKYGKTSEYNQETTSTVSFTETDTLVLTNLNPNNNYHYRLIVTDRSGNKARSQNAVFSTTTRTQGGSEIIELNNPLIAPPRLFTVEPSSSFESNSALLSWSQSSTPSIDGYTIYRSVGTEDRFSEYVKVQNDKTSFDDTNVTPGSVYYYYIVSYRGPSESSKSPIKEIKIPNTNKSVLGVSDSVLGDPSFETILILAGASGISLGFIYFSYKRVRLKVERAKEAERQKRLVNVLRDPNYFLSEFEESIIDESSFDDF